MLSTRHDHVVYTLLYLLVLGFFVELNLNETKFLMLIKRQSRVFKDIDIIKNNRPRREEETEDVFDNDMIKDLNNNSRPS